MSKSKIVNRKRRLELAIKQNKQHIKISKKPHERDIARFRINILKRKLSELEKKLHGS